MRRRRRDVAEADCWPFRIPFLHSAPRRRRPPHRPAAHLAPRGRACDLRKLPAATSAGHFHGVSYRARGLTLSGGDLGADFIWPALARRLGNTAYQPDRDLPRLLAPRAPARRCRRSTRPPRPAPRLRLLHPGRPAGRTARETHDTSLRDVLLRADFGDPSEEAGGSGLLREAVQLAVGRCLAGAAGGLPPAGRRSAARLDRLRSAEGSQSLPSRRATTRAMLIINANR